MNLLNIKTRTAKQMNQEKEQSDNPNILSGWMHLIK